jgi:U3 small nucleolar RNA-associated protein 14
MAEPSDDDIDLGISLVAVATIVSHARAVQEPEEAELGDGDEDEDLDEEDDLSEDSLRAFITELNEDEQAALIALAWVGRGDYEATEWEEAKTLAAERNAGRDASDYLLGLEGLGDLLEEGVAAFGLSLDDVDV